MKNTPMRQWASASYDPKSGRQASAYGDGQSFSAEGMRISPSSQVKVAYGKGHAGAPGIPAGAQPQESCADKGRTVMNRD
jgi:hypothetical protein